MSASHNAGRGVVLSDEFDGFCEDLWTRSTHGFNCNRTCFDPDHLAFRMEASRSVLAVRLEAGAATCPRSGRGDLSARTPVPGRGQSQELVQYGSFRSTLQAARGSGLVTAFFVYTPDEHGAYDRQDEVDIELLGSDLMKAHFNTWRRGVDHRRVVDLGFDAGAGFHEYGFDWLTDRVDFLVDRRVLYTTTEGVAHYRHWSWRAHGCSTANSADRPGRARSTGSRCPRKRCSMQSE